MRILNSSEVRNVSGGAPSNPPSAADLGLLAAGFGTALVWFWQLLMGKRWQDMV